MNHIRVLRRLALALVLMTVLLGLTISLATERPVEAQAERGSRSGSDRVAAVCARIQKNERLAGLGAFSGGIYEGTKDDAAVSELIADTIVRSHEITAMLRINESNNMKPGKTSKKEHDRAHDAAARSYIHLVDARIYELFCR